MLYYIGKVKYRYIYLYSTDPETKSLVSCRHRTPIQLYSTEYGIDSQLFMLIMCLDSNNKRVGLVYYILSGENGERFNV